MPAKELTPEEQAAKQAEDERAALEAEQAKEAEEAEKQAKQDAKALAKYEEEQATLKGEERVDRLVATLNAVLNTQLEPYTIVAEEEAEET